MSQAWSPQQRGEAERQPRFKALGEGQKFGVTPHVRWPLGNALTRNGPAQRVIVVGNFQGGETIVADGAGLVSPCPSAFAAPQFVVRHVATRFPGFALQFFRSCRAAASSRIRARKSGQKSKGLLFQEKEKRLSESKYSALTESHVPCFQERVGTSQMGYMIPVRLPWRHRARPSATLHEIQVHPEG